ncbi:HAD-IIIC family phosphatase [Pectobacterium brasiliense]|uniref:HAD-IIIC family phosphatase n=1 Tax=Pectobacterium brasiliense TaxID=180957 RepID=UPI001968DBA8|nr:HAD-IIIC family phosphatase [Pectobacterium brasiliense]MBN3161403.1 HAD-IIIC family phosphatase [Pectobacterium brasiliense]
MKIKFSSNITIDFLAKKMEKKHNALVSCSQYNQYYQDISFGVNGYYENDSDYYVLILEADTLAKDFSYEYEAIAIHLKELVHSFYKNKKDKILLISNFYIPLKVNSILNYNSDVNIKNTQQKLNLLLNDLSIEYSNVYVLDFLSEIEKYGEVNLYDKATWVYGKNRYANKGLEVFCEKIIDFINSLSGKVSKCIVLDLDNTLWGGILGEDGPNGIQLSSYGVGSIYKDFQRELIKIKQKGILLALCSKNNISDVELLFEQNPEMLLKLDDFVIKKINWNLKSDNLIEIADELNLGQDALVFIDDNPMERQLVRTRTNVVVPDFPDDIDFLLDFIVDVDRKFFSKIIMTNEDFNKTLQYQQFFLREKEAASFNDYSDFIKSLNIEVTIRKNDKKSISRISQLTQKTNQFNFTTKRYSESDIENMINSEKKDIYTGEVTDKFGKYGLVIMAIIDSKSDDIIIDSFLMSCRVIGKMVEKVFIYNVLEPYKHKHKIVGLYKPTKKNILVEDFYSDNGFVFHHIDSLGQKNYYATKLVDLSATFNIEVKYA